MGWSIDSHQATPLVTNALGMAIANRDRDAEAETVIHSDHGPQFTSYAFAERAKQSGLLPSSTARSPGRSTVAPDFLSNQIRSAGIPAAVSASTCRSRSCLAVDTRAYPRSIPGPYRNLSPYNAGETPM